MLIPERNRRHLMLDRDVVDAVSRGLFQVHTVAHVLDGIELLTGNPAGDPEVADSVLARAGQTLRDVPPGLPAIRSPRRGADAAGTGLTAITVAP